MMDKFAGFEPPQQNWSKLPHDMIAALPQVETVSELKVILYVLRHTWGFQEFDGEPKRITLDEFSNGRKKRDGTRLDNGTGLSKNAIKDGIKRAIEHGFIIQEDDGRDAARNSHVYALRMMGGQTLTSGVSNSDTLPSNSDTRSEKDTLEKIPEKDSASDEAGDELTGDELLDSFGLGEWEPTNVSDEDTRSWRERAEDDPWLTIDASWIHARNGTSEVALRRTYWLVIDGTGWGDPLKPEHSRWMRALHGIHHAANGDFGLIEHAIKHAMNRDPQYRPSGPEGIINAVRQVAGDWSGKKTKAVIRV